MTNCCNCSKELVPNAKFCKFCGATQAVQPQPVNEIPVVAKVNTVPACIKCGNALIPNAKFCKHCGTNVDAPHVATLPITETPKIAAVNTTVSSKIESELVSNKVGSPSVNSVDVNNKKTGISGIQITIGLVAIILLAIFAYITKSNDSAPPVIVTPAPAVVVAPPPVAAPVQTEADTAQQAEAQAKFKLEDANEQLHIGNMYYGGDGKTQDYAQAFDWYKKAAEQGNAEGQLKLAVLYYTGQGTDKNYEEALYWANKAAEQNDADAQYLIGTMYEAGEGVAIDETQAISWYKKAAKQGNANAKTKLSKIELASVADAEEQKRLAHEEKIALLQQQKDEKIKRADELKKAREDLALAKLQASTEQEKLNAERARLEREAKANAQSASAQPVQPVQQTPATSATPQAAQGKFQAKFRGFLGVKVATRYYATEDMKNEAMKLWKAEGKILETDGSITIVKQENKAAEALGQ